MRNMEIFAIGGVIHIFAKKAQEVRDVFWNEVERLHEDFDSMQDTLLFYEATLNRVISTKIRQEMKLNEVT